MGIKDKLEHAAEEAEGKAKEAAGKATDNEDLESEGWAEKKEADLKQTGDKVKDVFDE